MTVGDLEEENRRLQGKAQEQEDRIKRLNYDIEEWKQKFENLEKEKETLYLEMKEKSEQHRISAKEEVKVMKETNENMVKYIRKLEGNVNIHLRPFVKDITNLSKRQVERRSQELGRRAQKALCFAKSFALEPEVLQLSESKGHVHSINIKSKQISSSPSPSESPPLAQSQIYPDSPQTSQPNPDSTISTSEDAHLHASHNEQSKNKQYDSLSEADKEKAETVLYLMDKFSVGNAFIYELNMEVNGMPKSYLIRQCRDKLNSACSIRSTLGDAPGAQVSLKEALINKLNILASINSISINIR